MNAGVFYYQSSGLLNDTTEGPFSTEQMVELILNKKIKPATNISDGVNWMKLSDHAALAEAVKNEQRRQQKARVDRIKARQAKTAPSVSKQQQATRKPVAAQLPQAEPVITTPALRSNPSRKGFVPKTYPALLTVRWVFQILAAVTAGFELLYILGVLSLAGYSSYGAIGAGAEMSERRELTTSSTIATRSAATGMGMLAIWLGAAITIVGSLILVTPMIVLEVAIAEMIRLAMDVQASVQETAYNSRSR